MSSQLFFSHMTGAGARLVLGAALIAILGAGVAHMGAALAAPSAQSLSVQIYSDRLDPAQLTVEVASTVLFEATNRTSMDCTFYIEGLVSDFLVPANASAQNSFEVPNLPPSSDTTPNAPTGGPSNDGSVVVKMGCRGVDAQQGSAVVQRQPGT